MGYKSINLSQEPRVWVEEALRSYQIKIKQTEPKKIYRPRIP